MNFCRQCYWFFKYVVFPALYASVTILYWNNLCQTIHIMSFGFFIALVCGVEDCLLPFKLILSETKELHFPVTVILWIITAYHQMA